MRVYFDASVLIAALLSSTGGSSLLLQCVKAGKIAGITSQTVIDEILEEDKPEKLKRSKKEIQEFIAQSGLVVRESVMVDEIAPYRHLIDEEDAHLIAGANRTKCSHLVTLDKKHVLRESVRTTFLPLRIVSPKQLLEELLVR